VLLGHASIATTERYTAVDTDEVRAAMMSAESAARLPYPLMEVCTQRDAVSVPLDRDADRDSAFEFRG
jgi:hypothetical protein